ncbi:hypothetical protein ACGFZ7_02095 [Pseudomonas sp. NPDC047963]|nr:hypothetical protein [Pseudomonas sp.]
MISINAQQCAYGEKESADTFITAKSGLVINTSDDVWILLPNMGKGRKVHVGWVRSWGISDEDRALIIDVFAYFVRTKAASTASGVVTNVKPLLTDGIPTLIKVKSIWSGLKTNNKKGLNQFFGALVRHGYERFYEFHNFTRRHLDKHEINALDPSKGALSDIEFDSLAKQVNAELQSFDWARDRMISFYRSQQYGVIRNLVTNKLLLAIVRRPIQISVLKWSDVIPSGASFQDTGIRTEDEIGAAGGQTLQLRVFVAKATGGLFSRSCPERYPLHLSEDTSILLIKFKKLVLKGISLLIELGGIEVDETEVLELMDNMPMFPESSLFNLQFNSLEFFRALFTPRSTAYHTSETTIAQTIRRIRVSSDRSVECNATSNRIRHTVLTRGARDGLPASHLAKITGVTVPAARHYVDLDYESRRQIDTKYIGNVFLRKAFCNPLIEVSECDEVILDSNFNPVGGSHNKKSCINCSTVLGRPLGCYGCPNFRPILEADHRSVLVIAEEKLAINRGSLVNPLLARSIEKLERQIVWVKLTISICDEYIIEQRAIDA